jgi:hypothetical protein
VRWIYSGASIPRGERQPPFHYTEDLTNQ